MIPSEQKQWFIGNGNEWNIESLWRESSNYPGAVVWLQYGLPVCFVPLVAFSFFANYLEKQKITLHLIDLEICVIFKILLTANHL